MSRRGSLEALLLVAAIACGPSVNKGPVGPAGGALVPTPTPAGDPVALGTTATFPEAGGTFTAPDAGLTILMPPATVTTTITVTPIANLARGAIGPAYRLGPEGTTFGSPVTLTFKAPDRYPTGTGISGVGVSYQDAAGYWHRVEPVTRDAGARTVSVATTHFSDWALTWTGGTAAAEGPISLVQTYGIPFTATGRATVYFQGDDANDTVYTLTGTLTVPETIPLGGATCVPDQRTKTLPLNVAEAHKSDPPVFRWGIGVFWTLTCTAGPEVTTELMPALFDTMSINLTRCPGDYLPGQIVSADQLFGTYTKDCGVDGVVSATWDLRTCVAGLACEGGVECRLGETACTAGVQSCVDAGAALDGTPCVAGSCTAGICG